MYQFFTASKDATIYKNLPTRNTGRDEILEIAKQDMGSGFETSRFLIQFDTNEISSSVATGEVTMSSAELLFRECLAEEVPLSYTVYGYPVSQSWEMGIGVKFDNNTKIGVSWENNAGSASLWNTEGGDYITSSIVSQSVEYLGYDLTFEVSESLSNWINGSIDNYGWIFKLSDEVENDGNDYGRLQFFSKETNTIYQPKIRIGWDDQVFSPGSLTALTASPIIVTVKGLKTQFKVDSKPIIRVFGREQYPLKTYTNEYSYNDVKYLPSTTYYEIKDSITHEVIIPYSDYTKVSCDSQGNYIQLNFKNWEINRKYYINFKVVRNGSVEFFEDDDLNFKVVN